MKKTFIILILFFFILKASGQGVSNANNTKYFYLQKSKNQKTTGWILLSGGAAITIIGVIGFSSSFDIWDDSSGTDIYGYMFVGGPIVCLSSIPLFISSASNARKAATISIGNQPILLPKQNTINQNSQIALTLKITF